MMRTLEHYYDRVAPEYERLYYQDDPNRRGEKRAIAEMITEAFRDRTVLEVACGTGYWTRFAVESARGVLAIDTSPGMLEIARGKGLPTEKVQFRLGDAHDLGALPGRFDAGLANFWLSHVPRARVGAFLEHLHTRLAPGSVVVMADNVYVPGVGGELVSRPGENDTYKLRTLADGSRYEVLKNYYDRELLSLLLAPFASGLRVNVARFYWWLCYTLA